MLRGLVLSKLRNGWYVIVVSQVQYEYQSCGDVELRVGQWVDCMVFPEEGICEVFG